MAFYLFVKSRGGRILAKETGRKNIIGAQTVQPTDADQPTFNRYRKWNKVRAQFYESSRSSSSASGKSIATPLRRVFQSIQLLWKPQNPVLRSSILQHLLFSFEETIDDASEEGLSIETACWLPSKPRSSTSSTSGASATSAPTAASSTRATALRCAASLESR